MVIPPMFRMARLCCAIALVLALTLSACDLGGGGEGGQSGESDGGKPQAGGTLTVAINGGPTDTLNPWLGFSAADMLRIPALYESLTRIASDGSIDYVLAKSIEPNDDATVWTLKLRDDVRFNDGSPLTAKDVLWSFSQNIEQQLGGYAQLALIDLRKTRVLDPRTIEIVLKRPDWDFPYRTAGTGVAIAKAGTDFTDSSVSGGTGPFRLESFTPGRRSVFVRNENYHVKGRPYLDRLEIVNIEDPVARTSAVLSGEVDVAAALPNADVDRVEQAPSTSVASAPASSQGAFYMRADTPPFDDPAVRKALRLAIDRGQCVESAYAGHGETRNDLFGTGGAYYNSDLPQRQYDPEAARQLLAEAGVGELKVELVSGPAFPGAVECATVLEESAKAAGIDVSIRSVPAAEVFNPESVYLKAGFGPTTWGNVGFLESANLGLVPGAPYPETANDVIFPDFADRFAKAQATEDESERRELYDAIQRDLWERGGYIVWGARDVAAGHNDRVHGLSEAVVGEQNIYTNYLTDVWVD